MHGFNVACIVITVIPFHTNNDDLKASFDFQILTQKRKTLDISTITYNSIQHPCSMKKITNSSSASSDDDEKRRPFFPTFTSSLMLGERKQKFRIETNYMRVIKQITS